MSDPIKAFADALPSEDEFLKLWSEKAKENGADVTKLLKSQADGLIATSKQFVSAFNGTERDQRRLDAMLALGKFNAECEAFMELDAWSKALLATLQEIGKVVLDVGVKAIVASLAASLKGGLG